MMGIDLTAAGFRKIQLDTPEGWDVPFNQNWDILQAINAVGGFAVRAHDLDPDTLVPTSLLYDVAAGLMISAGGFIVVAAQPSRMAPANVSTYVWLDVAGVAQQGAALPVVGAYTPLALITCGPGEIAAIADHRNPARPLGGPVSLSRVATAVNYTQVPGVNVVRVDATGGPRTITLGAATANARQLIIIRKADASANAVTVASAALIDGAASISIAAKGSVGVMSTGTTYEVVI